MFWYSCLTVVVTWMVDGSCSGYINPFFSCIPPFRLLIPHTMDPFVSSIQDTERAHSSNRSVLGSLPDNWFNSQSNQDYTQHESPLHASAEALLLLNNAQFSHANFADSGSFPAQKENLSTQFGGIPITAPVPLSYAVRGKAALKSILSIGEDGTLPKPDLGFR